MVLEEYPKITKSGWAIWPANNWSEFQTARLPNLCYLCVLRLNCCPYDFRVIYLQQTINITSFKRFFFRKFLFRFWETLYLFKSFFKFLGILMSVFKSIFFYVLVSLRCCIIILLWCSFQIFCCDPLIFTFYNIVLSLISSDNSGCSILERLFLEHMFIRSKSYTTQKNDVFH